MRYCDDYDVYYWCNKTYVLFGFVQAFEDSWQSYIECYYRHCYQSQRWNFDGGVFVPGSQILSVINVIIIRWNCDGYVFCWYTKSQGLYRHLKILGIVKYEAIIAAIIISVSEMAL